MASEHIITVTDDDSDSFYLGQINQRLLGMERVSAYPAGAPGNLATAIAIAHQLDGSISQVASTTALDWHFWQWLPPLIFYVPETPTTLQAFGSSDFVIWILLLALTWLMTQVLKKLRVTIPGLLAGTIDAASINLSEIELIKPPFFSSLLQWSYSDGV